MQRVPVVLFTAFVFALFPSNYLLYRLHPSTYASPFSYSLLFYFSPVLSSSSDPSPLPHSPLPPLPHWLVLVLPPPLSHPSLPAPLSHPSLPAPLSHPLLPAPLPHPFLPQASRDCSSPTLPPGFSASARLTFQIDSFRLSPAGTGPARPSCRSSVKRTLSPVDGRTAQKFRNRSSCAAHSGARCDGFSSWRRDSVKVKERERWTYVVAKLDVLATKETMVGALEGRAREFIERSRGEHEECPRDSHWNQLILIRKRVRFLLNGKCNPPSIRRLHGRLFSNNRTFDLYSARSIRILSPPLNLAWRESPWPPWTYMAKPDSVKPG
ncbi:hypothetical protein BC937DRAFT_89103 [Endogone sp. FLAS-F59071]|nr:hypothetical protein BC937DRAFT_89103 [Endogone sp. FLAS-F59071]|eukprot:RUS18149.1 hypothetical protein BC937DRAFT_89103 [Endogone sp. FLAS-F59071]